MNYVGIDLGGTRIKIGIVSGEGKVIGSNLQDVRPRFGLAYHLSKITKGIRQLMNVLEIGQVDGIAVAFPGLVDTESNKVIGTSGKYNDAAAVDLAAWARNEFQTSLKIENDARMACLGEWQYGAGAGYNDIVACTLGTGIGTAAIINGRVLRGRHFQAGILGGHTIIDQGHNGPVCSCGGYGCVESFASTWVIGQMAAQHRLFPESRLAKLGHIDIAAIFQMAVKGDELALQLQAHCLNIWGIGLVNLIHAYDPEIVIIGGGVAHAGNLLSESLIRTIRERAWAPSGLPLLKISKHPDTAALLAAPVLFNTND